MGPYQVLLGKHYMEPKTSWYQRMETFSFWREEGHVSHFLPSFLLFFPSFNCCLFFLSSLCHGLHVLPRKACLFLVRRNCVLSASSQFKVAFLKLCLEPSVLGIPLACYLDMYICLLRIKGKWLHLSDMKVTWEYMSHGPWGPLHQAVAGGLPHLWAEDWEQCWDVWILSGNIMNRK